MSEDQDVREQIRDLYLHQIAQGMLLNAALAELAETRPAVRACLEGFLWQAEIDQRHFGAEAALVNKMLPDVYPIIQNALAEVNKNLSKPLMPRKNDQT